MSETKQRLRELSDDDAALIAAMRNALPALLHVAEAAQAHVDIVVAALDVLHALETRMLRRYEQVTRERDEAWAELAQIRELVAEAGVEVAPHDAYPRTLASVELLRQMCGDAEERGARWMLDACRAEHGGDWWASGTLGALDPADVCREARKVGG